MDLKTAEDAYGLIEKLNRVKAEYKKALHFFDMTHENCEEQNTFSVFTFIDTEGPQAIVELQGEGEIAYMRQFLTDLLSKRVQDAERDIYALGTEKKPAISLRRDKEAVRLLRKNRFDENALYLHREYLANYNVDEGMTQDEFRHHVEFPDNYKNTIQEWIGDAPTVYYVHDNGGVQLIKMIS